MTEFFSTLTYNLFLIVIDVYCMYSSKLFDVSKKLQVFMICFCSFGILCSIFIIVFEFLKLLNMFH